MLGFGKIAKKVFGTANDRKLKTMTPQITAINALESELESLSDEALRARTDMFRQKIKDGASLDDLLVDTFATVREAAKRTLGQRHFDVQLMGGMVLHEGRIAEMKTGEGKTLVATLAVYLNALTGNGVHVVTVNDYLANRDADWMGQIYNFLGMSVGCIVPGLDHNQRKQAYASDITYGTNNEFGFDYLRDNLAHSLEQMVQRGHNFAIVDEVDSILIDEARTPLIISGPTEDNSELYKTMDVLVQDLKPEHYEVDEKTRSATLTEDGNEYCESLLRDREMLQSENLYDVENVSLVHHINQALKAQQLFKRDKDYIVKNDEVVIIDEFTGRMMAGRRYSEGLHQALEAKEQVTIQSENQTLAQVTFQNYFRLYSKLAGMTGTAMTEADEFMEVYSLDVMEIPTNVDIGRADDDDEVYRTTEEKYNAIVADIIEAMKRNQPILVGTTSIEKSEYLADLLKQKKIPHNVLNARYHEQEAVIIAQAGKPGAITIATNMAGRGTDIQLGGNLDMRISQETADLEDEAEIQTISKKIADEVAIEREKALKAGGLYVMGTERHESRRIDNQLRGRSGRQGDPGKSKFFLSLQDDLMRIFGSERMDSMLVKLGLKDGEAIVHPWINKALEKAQAKIEGRNFDARKHLLKFDNVMNDQRKAIFDQRVELMEANDVSETIAQMRDDLTADLVDKHMPEKALPEQWATAELKADIQENFGLDLPIEDWAAEEGIANEEIHARVLKAANERAAERAVKFGPDVMRQIEKSLIIQTIDHHWREHLVQLEHLSKVIGFRGYGQRDPLNEYKTESFELFEALLGRLRHDVTRYLMNIEVRQQEPEPDPLPAEEYQEIHANPMTGDNEMEAAVENLNRQATQSQPETIPDDPSTWGKVGRNASCPCGSGKKFKHCHGALV